MQDFGALLQSFWRQEDGAVTVDWTVLAAAIVGLGLATVAAVRTGAVSLGTDIDSALTGASVASLGSLGSAGDASTAGWTLLDISQATYDGWLTWAASQSPELLANMFTLHQGDFANSGQTSAYDLDAMAMYVEALTAQGYDTTAMTSTLNDSLNAYNALNG